MKRASEIQDYILSLRSKNDEEEIKKGIEQLNILAENGCNEAYIFLAEIYFLRTWQDGRYKNPKAEFQIYLLAANKNFFHALYPLAICYINGHGVEQDIVQAWKLMERAANGGHEEAIRRYLFKAIEEGNNSWIVNHFNNELNLKKINLNKVWDDLQNSPLYAAVYHGKIDIVNTLLKLGADPNIPAFFGYMETHGLPIHAICKNKCVDFNIRLEIGKILVQYGANLNPTSRWKSPCFSLITIFEHENTIPQQEILLKHFIQWGARLELLEHVKDSEFYGQSVVSRCITRKLPFINLVLEYLRQTTKKYVPYKRPTEEYENLLHKHVSNYLTSTIERADENEIYNIKYHKKELQLIQEKREFMKNTLIKEVFEPVRDETLDFQRRLAFLSGFNSRLGQHSVLSSKHFKKNTIFSRDPVKLIFQFSNTYKSKDYKKTETNNSNNNDDEFEKYLASQKRELENIHMQLNQGITIEELEKRAEKIHVNDNKIINRNNDLKALGAFKYQDISKKMYYQDRYL